MRCEIICGIFTPTLVICLYDLVMDPTTHFFAQQKISRYESDVQLAISQLQRAGNVRELAQATHRVPVLPSWLRSLAPTHLSHRFTHLLNERAEFLIDQRLAEIFGQPEVDHQGLGTLSRDVRLLYGHAVRAAQSYPTKLAKAKANHATLYSVSQIDGSTYGPEAPKG